MAYNLATDKYKGWMPSPFLPPTVGGGALGPIDQPALQAMDETGLIAGPMEEGVGYIDTTALIPGTQSFDFTNAYQSPATGSVSGGTQTSWDDPANSSLSAVYFGSAEASEFSETQNGNFDATTPRATADGPVTVFVLTADKNEQIVPDGFSYGPSILEVTPSATVASGHGIGIAYGYGYGQVAYNAKPTGLTVTVGGHPAPVTAYSPNAYGSSSSPFPLEAFAFIIPPGVAGTPADLVMTTPSGSATAQGAISYVPEQAG